MKIISCPLHKTLEVERLRTLCWKSTYKGIIEQNYIDQQIPENARPFRDNMIRQGDFNNLIATENDVVIGFADSGLLRGSFSDENLAEIYALYVHPNHQKKGIGRQLLENHIKILNQQGYIKALIWTLKDNISARKFYECSGGILEDEKIFEIGEQSIMQVMYVFTI